MPNSRYPADMTVTVLEVRRGKEGAAVARRLEPYLYRAPVDKQEYLAVKIKLQWLTGNPNKKIYTLSIGDFALRYEDDDSVPTVDSNGAVLQEGDSVTLIKDLDVKGAGFTAKRGTLVKGIRLTNNPLHIEGKVNGVQIVLVAAYLKKA